MGRRSISSTKAGKFMNPTDQARKEARRKELKKNKKQRLQVRQAVIKQKDPRQIFAEMESIDKQEYDPNSPPPYNVKVLQEKRRKLKESWLKIYHFYQREDPKTAGELKSMEVDYERRRHQMVTIYESVMQAQKVKLDDIPLPSLCMPPPPPPPLTDESMVPVSTEAIISAPSTVTPKSILKSKINSTVVNTTVKSGNKEPPGPPPGSPPSLEEFECENDEYELGLTANEAYKSQEKPKKLRFDSASEEQSKSKLVTSSASVSATSTQPMYNRVPPPPPPNSQSASVQYQQQQIAKTLQAQMTGSRIVQQQPPQAYYHQQTRHVEPPAAQSITPATIFQAKPVLRNKMAEITRFTPTSLVVKRTDSKKQPLIGSAQQPSILSQQSNGISQQGPYNYMLQQQQQYATLNPLNTYKSSLSANSNYSSALIPTQVQLNKQQQSSAAIQPTPIISSNRPTATRIDPKDAAYESFMREIGKLL